MEIPTAWEPRFCSGVFAMGLTEFTSCHGALEILRPAGIDTQNNHRWTAYCPNCATMYAVKPVEAH